MPIEVLMTFFSASVMLALAPGPDNIFVLIHSALHGRISGFFVTLGLCTGLIVHTSAAAIGLAALFKVSKLAFIFLKTIGAIYLVYLSIQSFRASVSNISFNNDIEENFIRLYRRGIVMNVTNPNVSIFFMAFLPQFIKDDYGPVLPQFFLLGGLFMIATMAVFGLIAFLASSLGRIISRSDNTQKVLSWIAGTVFLGIALNLVFTKK